jgi:hypothetical protein
MIWSFRGDMIWWNLLGLPAASEYLKKYDVSGTDSLPETSYFLNILMRLVAEEDFIKTSNDVTS